MDIFAEARKLKLPPGEYVVIGSGVLAAHGIREANDLDLVASASLYALLREEPGWEEVSIRGTSTKLLRGDVEVVSDLVYDDYRPRTEDLIRSAEVINGIPFLPLLELRAFKQALGREKDLRDIELIDSYLEKETHP